MGPLLLKVCYTSIPLLPNPTPPPSPFILPPFPHSSASCVCMYMHARLLTCVSHRSPLRRRLPSWGDAWAPPVNFTAFIWPDEWLAALSVPLPAISSGSLEPHTACRFFGRSLQHAPIPLLLHTHQTLRDAQLHTDDTVLHAQFRKQHAHEPNKQCSNRSGRKLCRAQTHTLSTQGTQSIRTCQLANPSSLFLPQCAHIFLVAAPCSQKYLFLLIFFFFFSWGNTKEITPLFLPGSCQNNQCFPERDLWRDMRGGKAEGCRHSSRALVVDNKWGAVLGYVLQLSRLIIFDMHSGVYTVSSVKSSPAIEGNRAQGAHTAQHVHILHAEALRKEEPLVAFLFSLPFSLFSPCPISYPRHNWRR